MWKDKNQVEAAAKGSGAAKQCKETRKQKNIINISLSDWPLCPGSPGTAGYSRLLRLRRMRGAETWNQTRVRFCDLVGHSRSSWKKKVIGAHLLPENRKLLLPRMHDEWNGEQDFKTNKFKFQAANCNKGNWTARKNKKSEICTCTERKSMAIT